MSTPKLGFLSGKPSGQHDPAHPTSELMVATAFDISDECTGITVDRERATIAYLHARDAVVVQIMWWQNRAVFDGTRINFPITGRDAWARTGLANWGEFKKHAELLGIAPERLNELVFTLYEDLWTPP